MTAPDDATARTSDAAATTLATSSSRRAARRHLWRHFAAIG